MTITTHRVAKWFGTAAEVALATYAGYVAFAWITYGCNKRSSAEADLDPLLDQFMPEYEVIERHSIRISARPEIAFVAACRVDLTKSALVRAIFHTREMILGAKPSKRGPSGLVELTRALGWAVLAEGPMREVVMGAVTQPWAADPVFRAVPPTEFATFCEPGYVKIAWTLRADSDGPFHSIIRTETRAATTSCTARAKFRRYWAAFSPGIVLIRRAGLRLSKTQAELMTLETARVSSKHLEPKVE